MRIARAGELALGTNGGKREARGGGGDGEAEGPGGGEGVRSPRSPGLSKQEVLGAFDAAEAEGEAEADLGAHLQTDFQTVLNTVGLLSMGYAVMLGGWMSLLVLALCTTLFCTTARLLCHAFDALPPSTLQSYPALARFAFGLPGEWAVMVAVLFEFWGALGMCLIIVWQSALIFLPPLPTLCLPSFATSAADASAPSAAPLCLLPRHLVIAASLALVIPTVLVRSFARLTNVALSGVASSTLLCSGNSYLSLVPVMLGTWASDPSSAALPEPRAHHHSTVSWSHLPMAAGIFMVSLSGHAGLPSLRRSMRTPEHFDQCIIVTFSSMFLLPPPCSSCEPTAMLLLYATMGGFAYLYFGDSVRVLVTASLADARAAAWSHHALYATMGGFAYLYFGDSVRVLVTASLDDAGAAAGIILLQWGSVSVSLSALLSLLVAASVFTTIPALVYVMSELILDLSARLGLPVSSHKPTPSAADPVADGAESVCPADGGLPPPQCSAQPVPHRHSAIAEGITRVAVTFVGYLTAYLTYDVLDRVESVVGGVCSVGVSMVLPAVIFDRLYSHQLSVIQLTLLRGLIAFGVIAACGIAYINIFK
ncbi:unnamed protein product [Closterium sp. NIES-64]|nr:unnamed protein product [Closterium sp. NIES-64]